VLLLAVTIHFMSGQRVVVEWLGRVDYQTAWDMQRQLVAEASVPATDAPHRLLLLEHPPTYTLGRRGKLDNLLLTEDELSAENISVFHVDRGGDITYHGPGQLVGYPILNLRKLHNSETPDLHRYLRDLEQTIIDTLAQFGIEGWRFPGYTGVWVRESAEKDTDPSKIAAIGVKVSGSGITSHGFALNVAPNHDHFNGIIPCGIVDHGVASMVRMLPDVPPVDSLIAPIAAAFSNVFQLEADLIPTYNPSTITQSAE
jgi:lipoate-protein ligase B